MEKAGKSRILSSWCFFRASSVFVAPVLVPSLVLASFLAFGFSSFLVAISILFLSSIFIVTLSKKKAATIVKNIPAQDVSPVTCGPENQLEEKTIEKPSPEAEAVTQCNGARQSEVCHMIHEYQVEATDFPPDSESSDGYSASEHVEVCWLSSANMGQDVALSESSISDDDDVDDEEEEEDNLIEISFPKSSSIDLHIDSDQKLQPNVPGYLPESIFMQEDQMELMAEIDEASEEENLIEIDLSMGSIK